MLAGRKAIVSPSVIEGFSFRQEDLDANRAGRLTDQQVERIRTELQRRTRIIVPLLILGPLPLAWIAAIASARSEETAGGTFLPALALLYVVSLLVIAPLAGIGLYTNFIKPIRKGNVTSETGPIKLIPRGDDVHLKMGSRLKGPRFAMAPEQAEALIAGDVYTIYFTPAGKRSVFHSIDHTPPLIPPDSDVEEGEDQHQDEDQETSG